MLRSFMIKIEMHKIELQVFEFEIRIIEDRDNDEEEEEEEGRMGFVSSAKLEINRRPGAHSAAPLGPGQRRRG